jgi:hypothetical protein
MHHQGQSILPAAWHAFAAFYDLTAAACILAADLLNLREAMQIDGFDAGIAVIGARAGEAVS